MTSTGAVKVRVFGSLQGFQRKRGLPCETLEEIPEDGMTAGELALRMGLPVESIEGAFCNHIIFSLTRLVMPGDEVAFVPYGTPGPHRYYLGLYKAGHGER